MIGSGPQGKENILSSQQRRYERFDIFERAAIVDESGHSTSVIMVDLSLGGAQLLSRAEFKGGSSCKLVVGSGNEATTLSGAILYCRPGEYDMLSVGFKHTSTNKDERVAIANLVNRVFMNPSEVPEKPVVLIEHWLGKQSA